MQLLTVLNFFLFFAAKYAYIFEDGIYCLPAQPAVIPRYYHSEQDTVSGDAINKCQPTLSLGLAT